MPSVQVNPLQVSNMSNRFFGIVTLSATMLLSSQSFALAGPPFINDSSKGSSWTSNLNPTNWSWPKPPWSGEPARIKKKSPGMMSSANQAAKNGWNKTKNALNPAKMFPSSSKSSSSSSSSSSQPSTISDESKPGFFGGMFSKEEPKKINTVNDFLKQPMPQ